MHEGQGPFSSDLFEVEEEASKASGKMVIEVTNVREDGTIEGSAPFGNFVFLRAGLHFQWKKK